MVRRIQLFAAVTAGLLLRLVLIFRYRFDSDESQHMHVAWGWAHHLVQYRDVFDNHMPLFHLLSAPLFFAAGDDPNVLFAARILMVPFFAVSLWLVWVIARRLSGEKAAWWATAMAAFFSPYFLCSLEYRSDDPWVVCWLAAVAIAISDLRPAQKSAWAGAFVGFAFALSMKSVLFALALGGAGVVTVLLTLRSSERLPVSTSIRNMLIAAACAATPPALVAGAFAAAGAWRAFLYGVFEHNVFPYEHSWRVIWLVVLYPAVRAVALAIRRAGGDAPLMRRRLFVFLACAIYTVLLGAFWPLISRESMLPIYPLAILLVTPLVIRRRTLVPAICVALELIVLIGEAKPWRDRARHEVELVEQITRLTRPHEPVMDLKGETVFRPRPYYYAMEAVTNIKVRLGTLQDRIAETLVRTGTTVVVNEQAYPRDARRFVRANYVPFDLVRVAGMRVRAAAALEEQSFHISVPADYVVWDAGVLVPAVIDGVEVGSGLRLKAGMHTMVVATAVRAPVVVWAGIQRCETTVAQRQDKTAVLTARGSAAGS